jgi:GrpB-like predicted nucleotidyltransferase (UPF0157 family)
MTSRAGRPIVIADYDPAWVRRFEEERAMIYRACGRNAFVRIEHMGSTAVPGLAARPIIDIMPGVRSLDAFMVHIPALESLGYQYAPETERPMPELNDPGMPFRRYFRKEVDGERAFHLHTVVVGSEFWRDQLMFRNYLRMIPDDARAYADLKRRLADTYNRTMLADNVNINLGYTDFKSELIGEIMAKARARIERSTPVAIVPYNALWPAAFERERAAIVSAIGGVAIDVQHVGSTSVAGLGAKPTIDIAIGVRSMDESRAGNEALFALGYAKGRENFQDWRYFDREGHAPMENVHLHMVPFGGDRWNRYLLFRDYLRAHPDAASSYEKLKRELAGEFGSDRLGYVEGKSEFIEMIAARARGAG